MQQLLASSVLTTIWSILLALVILLVMVTVHEFGHYLVGKALGFQINEFAIGFGPKLFHRKSKKSGEEFSVRALPLGGFCAFAGEDSEDSKGNANAFLSKAPWTRILVFLAGPTMNYLLALIVILISFSAYGQMFYQVKSVEASDTYDAAYSLQADDIILQAEGRDFYLVTDLMKALKGKQEGDIATLTVERAGEHQQVQVMLRADCDFANYNQSSKLWKALGLDTVERDGGIYYDLGTVSVHLNFGEVVGHSFVYSGKIAGTIFSILGQLLTGKLGFSTLGGPVTTIKITSEAASKGLQSFFEISAFIGVNLAVFNLLPIPALDGSKVIFCLIEWICKKPVPRKIEAIIHAVGFVLILGFSVLMDILQLV
jgi:regulator of sigma E protease